MKNLIHEEFQLKTWLQLSYKTSCNLDWARRDSLIDVLDDWCEENLQGKFCLWYETQHFEVKEDMILFVLRWITT